MALLSRFFGRTASEGAAFALGTAVGPALGPAVRELVNEANSVYPSRVLDAATSAAIVAEDVERHDWGAAEAVQSGVNGDRFAALLGEALNAPGIGELFAARRRSEITAADFTHGLRKAKLEPRWDAPLEALLEVLLSPSELANARQQGFVSADRARAEAALQGLDAERADLQFELSGLPLGVGQMQAAANRGLADRATFDQAIREGRTKTKYTGLAWALRAAVLTATQYSTLYLKGWIGKAERDTGGALTGYTPEQMDLLYLSQGRPAAPGQMATAAARGIDGPDGKPMDEAQFLKGIKESDIRPEWGPMLWQSRFLYPPLFQISRLVTGGQIDAKTGAEWAKKDRYPPEVVDALEKAWTTTAPAKADPHVVKAQNQLWTQAHASYLSDEATEAATAKTLQALGVAGPAQTAVLDLWKAERALIRKQLTPAQIKKAWSKLVKHAATGQPWTREQAIDALIGRGYSLDDANTFLDQ